LRHTSTALPQFAWPRSSPRAGDRLAPLLGGTQHLIGRLHLLEAFGRRRIVLVDVGMIGLGQPPPRTLIASAPASLSSSSTPSARISSRDRVPSPGPPQP
jgi:hypothetical protein